MQIFTFIWLGQLISLLGVAMTGFAMEIWVYQQTNSATQFALLNLCYTIPLLLISPIAGTFVDRWDRRWIMIISHVGEGLCTLILILLISIGQLEIWQIFLSNIFRAITVAFHSPAYKASIISLVSEEDLSRVNSMIQLGRGIQRIISPLLAGIMLELIGIRSILIIDFITLFAAFVPLVLVRFPYVNKATDGNNDTSRSSFLKETLYGWTYLTDRSGLFGFIIMFTIYQLMMGFVNILSLPLILSLTTPSGLGWILFLCGIGIFLGTIVMNIWKSKEQKLVDSMLIAMSFNGLLIIIAGLRPSIIQFAIAALCFFMGMSFINVSVQTILQTRIPGSVQGRIFGLTGAIWGATAPLGGIVAGPLADYVFEPRMAFDGIWSQELVGQVIGSGPGRGVGLLFVIIGCCILVTAFVSSQYAALRNLEVDLPNLNLQKV